ncbi:repeat-containing 12-like [Podarcis lilfordi]|uniref:Repeat-containing 12-like n=1 Tax=Podarcis lilfordi TaxID=74358 RepID=A0AA35P9V6_9SAUR|nr:repeat-containing 12-like [Podarcis lilfordi]
MKYFELVTTKNVVSAATGAGAIFLMAKTIMAGIKSPPYNPEPLTLAKLAIEHQSQTVLDSGELRGLLNTLNPKLDDYSKNMLLHGITRCVYLLDNEEFFPKVLEMVASIWDHDLHAAGLRLLNGLPLSDHTFPLVKKLMPAFMEILQMGNTLCQVQVLKFLGTLAQKEALLFDIMNCQVHPDFLHLFQPSRPGNLLFELLVFVERLCEGRLTPQYQSVSWQYNESSLHEVLFGDDSRLADRLLSLIIHPEEEVQIQACRVILKLQLNEEGEMAFLHNYDSTFFSDSKIGSSLIKSGC